MNQEVLLDQKPRRLLQNMLRGSLAFGFLAGGMTLFPEFRNLFTSEAPGSLSPGFGFAAICLIPLVRTTVLLIHAIRSGNTSILKPLIAEVLIITALLAHAAF